MVPPSELMDFLKKEDNFIIATHYSPDADGLGSALALSMALRKLGKKTLLLDRDSVPNQCRFMPGHEEFQTLEAFLSSGSGDFRNLVLVDCNDLTRISSNKSQISNLKFQISAVIDHHESERPFGDIRWIRPDSPATGIMVYYILKELCVEITKELAVNLYAAIAVDTGNFRHANTTADALRIAAEMAGAGAKPHEISMELYESWSDGRFMLFRKALNTLQIEECISIITVTLKMLEETGTTPDDTENLVEFPRIMKKIAVSILFREIGEDHYKVSLRSKGGINVARVAETFKGGGHKNAAGCTVSADIETAKNKVLEAVKSLSS